MSIPTKSIGDLLTHAEINELNSRTSRYLNVKDFGAIGDGTTDDTDALTAAINYAVSVKPAKLYFPKGVYAYTQLPTLAYPGSSLSIQGDGINTTILKCTSTVENHNAIDFDTFGDSETALRWSANCNVDDITFQGNEKTLNIVFVQGIARSRWKNVSAKIGKSTGSGFRFAGTLLCEFSNLYCSTQLDIEMYAQKPYYGFNFATGLRAGVITGNTANVFINPCVEGLSVGMQLTECGSTTFIGGTSEVNTVYGVYIPEEKEQNTFIDIGLENPDAIADFADYAQNTIIMNSYTSNLLILGGKGAQIIGGYHQDIKIKDTALYTYLNGPILRYRPGFAGGLTENAGSFTQWQRLTETSVRTYTAPTKASVAISMGNSPFTWVNETKQFVDVMINDGTVSAIILIRGAEEFTLPVTSNKILLAPKDSIKITYTGGTTMKYLPQNGFMG